MKYTLSSGLIVTDIYVQGINGRDYPEFSDAYIESASVLEHGDWRDANDHELDEMNNDGEFVYSCIENQIY